MAHQLGGTFARFYQRSYAPDYVALGLLIAGWIVIQLFVTPFHRMFSLDDRAIQYPFAEVERVPVSWNIFFAGLIPLLTILLWSATFLAGAHKTKVTILGLLVALVLTSLVTDIIKNAVGRPRPDLISRCVPHAGTAEAELVTYTVCSQEDQHKLQEGWRSFPSGHSSFSFAGLGYLSLFFSGQMHVFRPRADLPRCLLAFVPLLGAAMVAVSRLADYRHDVYDVTCGSLLGFLVAFFSYRRYYRSLTDRMCHEPYDKTDSGSATRFRNLPVDEEQQLQSRMEIGSDEDASGETFQLE